jgi:hypothetical protein
MLRHDSIQVRVFLFGIINVEFEQGEEELSPGESRAIRKPSRNHDILSYTLKGNDPSQCLAA